MVLSITLRQTNNPDTDGDGLTMVQSGVQTDPSTTTDPLNTDSDGDGIDDGVEDANQNGSADTTETDASNPDTDGDGIDDGTESGVNNDTQTRPQPQTRSTRFRRRWTHRW